jgi:4-amino-4-deoxy-L-arabinose transferase-like glycosyltransferase
MPQHLMLRFLAIAVIAAALYTYGLDRVPAALTLDEAHFSVHAHAIAETGRNLNGQRLPLLISLADPGGEPITVPWGETYYLPLGIYLIAGALQVLPLDEATVRLPSALLGGVVNVGLIFVAALVLFRDRGAALWSAGLLALAPANVIISRQAIDSVCQLPFTLGFLICLGRYLQAPQPRIAFAAGAVLGLGLYAYITSIAFMPFFLALFWLIAWRAGVLDRRAWALSVAGFAIALLPMIAWLIWHPEAFASIREQYNRADPGSVTLMQSIAQGGFVAAARELLRIYWSYFDPAFLFVQGGNSRTISTGEVGVFLIPIAILAPIGLVKLRAHRHVQLLLIVCLLAAAIPAAIKGAPYQIQRASGLLIFVNLLAGFGAAALWASRRLRSRAIVIAAAVAIAVQFGGFYRDYFTTYRLRSAAALDPTAFRGAAESIVAEDARAPVAAVYLPTNFYDVGAKWRFYTAKHARPELWQKTRYYAAGDDALQQAPPGSIAVIPAAGHYGDGWTAVATITPLAGEPTATVVRRGRDQLFLLDSVGAGRNSLR